MNDFAHALIFPHDFFLVISSFFVSVQVGHLKGAYLSAGHNCWGEKRRNL
jgi:hypothetical protein